MVDHLQVDKRFGTEEDFKELIDAAHNRGKTPPSFTKNLEDVIFTDMYVVMDLPVTSVSVNHPWFRDGETEVFVTAKEGSAAFSQPNYHKFPSVNGTKYGLREQGGCDRVKTEWFRYLGYPTAANPVLNWSNAKVKSTIEEAIKKYLLLGLDGFHIDHVSQLAVDDTGTPNVSGSNSF